MTNVPASDPIQHLGIPSGFGGIASRLYAYGFVPLNQTLPVTIEFINWGRVTSIGGLSSGIRSELVLDDVIINPIVTPGAFAALTLYALVTTRRRR